MKALSIRQPWAWLIANGWKDIENRDWRTAFRGPFLIHAAKTMTLDDYDDCMLFVSSLTPGRTYREFPKMQDLLLGGIVGRATIVDCVTAHRSEWFCGRFGFVIQDVETLPFFACRGFPSFFDAPWLPPPSALSVVKG